MTATTDCLFTVMDIDSIPDDEAVDDLLIGLVIGSLEGGKCAIRKDDSPAISHVCRVAFDNRNIVYWVGSFEQQATIEACWTAAKDDNLHSGLLQRYAINSVSAISALSIEDVCQLLKLG